MPKEEPFIEDDGEGIISAQTTCGIIEHVDHDSAVLKFYCKGGEVKFNIAAESYGGRPTLSITERK